MPIRTTHWKVGAKHEELKPAVLASERLLEEMIVTLPRMLSDE